MTDKKDIKKKISSVIDSIKDMDTIELKDQIDGDNQLFDYSNLLANISEDPEIAVGADIGHWRIMKLIGSGGMSIVYRVERNDDQLNQQAALKIIPNGLANKSMIDRFVRERQILSDLNHPNIAQLYDAGVTDQGLPWFVMEYIQGEDIISYAQNNLLNIDQRIYLIKQVCDALAYAHAHGIVHRDIKPNNLLVDCDKNIKLLDFGIASSKEQQSLTMTGAIIGTPGYMSPEQAKGLSSEIDRRSDIFSLGVLIYKLIKHDMPFQAESISEISYKIIHDEPTLLGGLIPIELQAITFKCLEKKVENRYSSITRLQKDLDAYLNGDVVSARKVTLIGRFLKKVKKHPIYSTFIFIAILSTILGISYGIYESFESVKKLQVSEKYLAKTQDLKANIRRIHMMPLHSIKDEYEKVEKEIESLKLEIENNDIDHSGLSYFALGEAFFNMKNYDKAYNYFEKAKSKGWHSKELSSGLGLTLLEKWQQDELKSKSMKKETKQQFLATSKTTNLLPAIQYLKEAQLGASDVNFLAAQMAYGEKNYDNAIEFTQKEMQANPWHYEALRLESEIYSKKFRAVAHTDGYDKALKYLELSIQKLDEAINIGRSDPHNYQLRCSNARMDVQVRKILGRNDELALAFDDAKTVCLNAIKLQPEAHALWSNLSLIYRSHAVWFETKNKPNINLYKQALDAANSGLEYHPNQVTLLSYKIRPLVALAELTYEQGNDPADYFNRAMESSEMAIKSNPDFGSAWKENARLHLTYADHMFKNIEDLKTAEKHYLLSIKAFKQANKIESSIIRSVNVASIEYYYSNLKIAQNKPHEAISILEQSIFNRLEVLPDRKLYFVHFMFVLDNLISLTNTKVLHDKTIETELQQAHYIFNKGCGFKDLSADQQLTLKLKSQIYIDNDWISVEKFSQCNIIK
jgi:serine/threonine protein kinase